MTRVLSAQNVIVLSKECEAQRQELRKFQGASYVMQQRIIRETQRLKDMTKAKGKLAEVGKSSTHACMCGRSMLSEAP